MVFFVVAALVFCRSRPRGIGVCRAHSGRHWFFLGENLEPRKKSGKTLMRRRDGQAKASSSEISCENSSRPASPRARRQRTENCAAARPAPERDDARTGAKFARAAMRLLCGADGNTVQTTAPSTAPASLATVCAQMTAAAAAAARVSRTRGGDNVSSDDPASCCRAASAE